MDLTRAQKRRLAHVKNAGCNAADDKSNNCPSSSHVAYLKLIDTTNRKAPVLVLSFNSVILSASIMGKKKKCTEKLKLFYRGPLTKSAQVADEQAMQTIVGALKDCVSRRDCAFKVAQWKGESNLNLKLTVGLSSCLRGLRQKRTEAIIYDDVAAPHLTKYLNDFANKANIPIIQAHRLIDLAPQLGLSTLLVVSLVKFASGEEEIYKFEANLKPKPAKEIISSEPLDQLCQLLQAARQEERTGDKIGITLRPPVQDKVASTGKSKAKKEAKRIVKKAKLA